MTTTQITPLESQQADPNVKQMYQAIENKFHMLPNIFKNMGHSGVALKAFLDLSEAANHSSIPPKLREKLALAVGQANGCQYCLSAHTLGAKATGISENEIMDARKARASIPKEAAILDFAKKVVEKKAHIDEKELASLKAAGVNDQEIVDAILVIMVNMYTNYFNLITGTKVDFPNAPELN